MMIKEFLNYLQYERNRSALTVKSYGEDARAFESYFKNLDTHLSWESVDSDIIRDWMESMMDKGNTAASINRRLSAVRSLYRFALSRGFVEHDPSRGVFGPKKNLSLPYFLREEEMDRLLDPGRWSDAYGDVCLRTMLMVFYETGVRLSELTGLDNASVDLANSELKVTGKRNKQRVIPFGDELRETLCTYIYKRDAEVSGVDGVEDAFFLTSKGRRFSNAAVRQKVKAALATVCTLKKRSPHVLRHSFATAMLNHDAGLESVRKLLGHESLSTTEIYTHTTFEQLKRVYSNAHPRA
ncbi:tyrosine-type recombinase/integrase [Leyella lascolaii]|jgi:integrase/recombinase XerC|uniref:tyrosine-type recombinase/integrase n=1 Tax=Leyella lascolaii TaxID=1776379 RepID=UPI00083AA25A|nr:tyrosine-type recombinase/integrase [Leyella lascolaii]